MKHSALPFFAGQHRQERFGARTVFSPLPVMTNVPPVRRTDWLTKKCPHYIELGEAGGSLFQTQILYSVWVLGLLIFAGMFWGPPGNGMSNGQGWAGVWTGLYEEVWIGANQWAMEFSWENLLGTILLLGTMPGLALFLTVKILREHQQQLRRVLPFRFHRQRREVMLSRWDKRTKRTEVRIFPWEEMCAMVGEGSAVSVSGVMTMASLFFGINSDERPGHFWSGMNVGTLSKEVGAGEWEMIRRYMEEGPEAIDEPAPVTFDGMIEEFCREQKIPRSAFSPLCRLWWELNGTRFGILRINIQSRLQQRFAERYFVSHPELAAWSEPLPPEQWAKPSERLTRCNQLLAEQYAQGRNIFTVGDVRELLGEEITPQAAQALTP
ncbi:hypothetical protein ACK33D_13635 [Aeromonas hydrophila]|uniref:hypothetical protein n=1 Tax=Aeromonas hydrophila TaxID=644 RepID=UPI0039857429